MNHDGLVEVNSLINVQMVSTFVSKFSGVFEGSSWMML